MLTEIWTGCKCKDGETWHVGIHKEFDCENDKEYEIPYCTICMSDNIKPKMIDGLQCMHGLTDEEIFWEQQNASDE